MKDTCWLESYLKVINVPDLTHVQASLPIPTSRASFYEHRLYMLQMVLLSQTETMLKIIVSHSMTCVLAGWKATLANT